MTVSEYNKRQHKYVWWVDKSNNGIIHISGIIGGRLYMMYGLQEAIRRYNTEARKTLQGLL